MLVFSGGFYLWTVSGWPGHLSSMIFQSQVLQSSSSSISKQYYISCCLLCVWSEPVSLSVVTHSGGLAGHRLLCFDATIPPTWISLAQPSPRLSFHLHCGAALSLAFLWSSEQNDPKQGPLLGWQLVVENLGSEQKPHLKEDVFPLVGFCSKKQRLKNSC